MWNMNTHTTWIRRLLVRELHSLVAELELFPADDLMWATPPGITNSAGNLTLHLCGNIQHFIGAVLGSTGYVRNREREFSARGIPRAALIAEVRTTIVVVTDVLANRPDYALLSDYPDVLGGLRVPCGLWLQHLTTHLAFHLGQVGYLRRILTGDATSAGAVPMKSLAAL